LATSGATKVSWAEIRLWRAVLLGAFLLLWEVATRRGWVDPFFVSQPTVLAAQIFDWIRSGFILRHLFVTLEETIIGFVLGTLLGVVVGFTFAHWPKLAHIFDPLMVALNAMPRVVLAPLFILWFGLGLLSKVVMVISLVFFVVFFSTYTGIREVDRDLVNNARILGANPRHMIRHVLLPSALTWIFSSLRTSVGFALIGAVVGEYLGSHEGMGYVISYAESMFNATGVLAGLLVLMAAVIAIDVALKRLDARFSYWKPVPK
jgi:NitT/TauT family transport system permease protein